MGGACSLVAMEKTSAAEAGEKHTAVASNNQKKGTVVMKTLKTVKSFGKSKKKKKVDSDNNPDSSPPGKKKKSLADEFRLSFSNLSSSPRNPGDAKASPKGSILGRASMAGLGRAVEVLDALGSGVANLNSAGFISSMNSGGKKISVLAFEVANTITKGANLMQSLSEENVRFIRHGVFYTEGVQRLVSTDVGVLLSLTAADKWEELSVFSQEVIRFGDICKDPQWHNLGRYFAKLDSEILPCKPLRAEAEHKMQELTNLAQITGELYHEMNAQDRFEQDYRQKLEEMKSLNIPCKGESLVIFQTELKHQKKLVWSLKKKSLWSKKLEEVVEKLVDIVASIHDRISAAFATNGVAEANKDRGSSCGKLGSAGLALHYANMISQIDNIASRPASLPPNVRDSLYRALPPNIKTALRSKLRKFGAKEELTVPQLKAKMEKTLQWLVPMAENTAKMHQGFGWVGEWASTSNEFHRKMKAVGVIRLQTLYHANKQETDLYILELLSWLHRLISTIRHRDYGFKPPPILHGPPSPSSGIFSSSLKRLGSRDHKRKPFRVELSAEERDLLERVSKRKVVPGISKSQEFVRTQHKGCRVWLSNRSAGSSPCKDIGMIKDLGLIGNRNFDLVDGLDIPF